MKSKRIGFDARLVSETGVGRYIKNLLHHLSVLDKKNIYYIFLNSSDMAKIGFRNPNFHKIAFDVKWHSLKEQLIFPLILIKYRLDIVHFPYFNIPILYPFRYLVTFHDLIIDHFPSGRASTMPYLFYSAKKFFYKIIVRIALQKAVRILAISRTTKNELINHYRISPEKIAVTYDALDSDFEKLSLNFRPEKTFNFDYILYVGNAYPHKNLEKLVYLWQDPQISSRVKLVLAGSDWFFYPRLSRIVDSLNLKNKVYFFGSASDKQLINLCSGARALIIPSKMEGLGLPNLEAVSLNLFPLVSDI